MRPGDEPREPSDLASALAQLNSPDPRARSLAAKALGRQGPDAAAALAPLLRTLRDPDPMVRSVAASAVGRIGGAGAVSALCALLEDPVVPVRFWAAEALGRLGEAGPTVLAGLRRVASQPEVHVRSAALRALTQLGASETPPPPPGS